MLPTERHLRAGRRPAHAATVVWLLGALLVGCNGQAASSTPTLSPPVGATNSASPGVAATESPSAIVSLAVTASPSPAESAPPTESPSPTESEVPSASPSASACLPTDQDADVYHPARLIVLSACIRVTGTVFSRKTEADGDLHIRLTVDPPYASLINAVNVSGQLGKLVVEPVCERPVTQADAKATCAADHDPLDVTGLVVGTHVWMEGRYVTDSQHGGWAELHPLYRWGLLP